MGIGGGGAGIGTKDSLAGRVVRRVVLVLVQEEARREEGWRLADYWRVPALAFKLGWW